MPANKEGSLLEVNGDEVQDEKNPSVAVFTHTSRSTWSGKLDFTMSALSLAVGMGNLWRFPYLCYRNGGGAFLIPYLSLAAILGVPMLFFEYALGQYGRMGIVPIWAVCPLFEGVGWSMFALSCAVSVYYIVIISWCVFYIAASLATDVPWRTCGAAWSTENCASMADVVLRNNCSANEGVWHNHTCLYTNEEVEKLNTTWFELSNRTTTLVSASDEYFHHYMLGLSDDLVHLGRPRWHLVLCLLACWGLVFFVLVKGIKASGKVMYVTALFPYIVLLILLIRALTLDGSAQGILYFITPQWHQLANPTVWGDAAIQLFFSLSLMWGGQLTLASFNNFHNNCLRDAVVVVVGDALTSLFGGVVIFAFLGYMANVLNVPVEHVVTQGAGLAFVVYPEGVTTLPLSQFWAVLFMLMLISVGLGTQFGIVQTVQTTLTDSFPSLLGRGRRPVILLLCYCCLAFLLGLPCTTNGGMYIIQLMDTYVASYGVMVISLTVFIAIPWIYGMQNFCKNIEEMTGYRPGRVWLVLWKVVTPLLLVFILIFSLINAQPVSYRGYTLPLAAQVVGGLFVIVDVMFIPGVALLKTLKGSGPFIQRVKKLTQPGPKWTDNSKIYDDETIEIKPSTDLSV